VLGTAISMMRDGLIHGTSGNVSLRSATGTEVLITPTGMNYARMKARDVTVVELDTGRQFGARRPSTELPMHLAIYRQHSWVYGIVHTHSRYATAFSVLRRPIPAAHYMMALLGDSIPVVDYATFGTDALAEYVARALTKNRTILLANHGALAVGESLDDAYRNALLIEEMAELCYHAMVIGRPTILDKTELDAARQQFALYGQPSKRKQSEVPEAIQNHSKRKALVTTVSDHDGAI